MKIQWDKGNKLKAMFNILRNVIVPPPLSHVCDKHDATARGQLA